MKIALLQMPVTADKSENLRVAAEYVSRAAEDGAEMAVLPEMFCCPYDNTYFPKFAEPRGGRIYTELSDMARKNGIMLVGGSMPEQDGEKIYNTSFAFDKDGREIARHRKVHLFDIDIKGGQRFFESDTFSAGEGITTFSAGGHTFGLCICFDIRFPEIFRCMALRGAEAVIVPAAFNMTTGPMHWELTFRMRAVDNQFYTLGAAPARDERGSYISYANSIACSPWGNVLARAGAEPDILFAEIDFDEIPKVRAQLPLLSARKPELYE